MKKNGDGYGRRARATGDRRRPRATGAGRGLSPTNAGDDGRGRRARATGASDRRRVQATGAGAGYGRRRAKGDLCSLQRGAARGEKNRRRGVQAKTSSPEEMHSSSQCSSAGDGRGRRATGDARRPGPGDRRSMNWPLCAGWKSAPRLQMLSGSARGRTSRTRGFTCGAMSPRLFSANVVRDSR